MVRAKPDTSPPGPSLVNTDVMYINWWALYYLIMPQDLRNPKVWQEKARKYEFRKEVVPRSKIVVV